VPSQEAPRGKDSWTSTRRSAKVIALTRSELHRTGTSLRTQLAEGLPSVQGGSVQLQQVMLNLILNAVEADERIETRCRASC